MSIINIMSDFDQFLPKKFQTTHQEPDNGNYCPINTPVFEYAPPPHHLNIPVIPIAIFILILMITGTVAGYLFFLKPKLLAVSIADKLVPKINKNITNIDNIGSKLNSLVFIILEDTPKIEAPKSADNNDTGSRVAGVRTNNNIYLTAYSGFKNLENSLSEDSVFKKTKKQVLGIEDLEGPMIQHLRKVKQFADDGKQSTAQAKSEIQSINLLLQFEIENNSSSLTQSEIEKLKDLNKRTQNYIEEIDKIFYYQSEETDVTIASLPLVVSYVVLITQLSTDPQPAAYLGKLDELQKTNLALKNRIEAMGKNRIPQGYNTMHEDNLKFFQYVDLSMTRIRAAVVALNSDDFLFAIKEFDSNLEPLLTKGITSSITYWKDNQQFKQYNQFRSEYNLIKTNLIDIKNKNTIPMMDIIPII